MHPDVLASLVDRRAELVAIEAMYVNWTKITEWHARTRPLVSRHFADQLATFDGYIRVRFLVTLGLRSVAPQPSRENDNKAKNATAKLLAQIDALIELAELDVQKPKTVESLALTGNLSNKVFVVHGHDEEMKQHVARTLSTLGLDPIILHEQPSGGRSVIEKFESNTDVAFAVVLLSPDDMAFSARERRSTAKPRARQNVVLELGYFVGKLGRNKVLALRRGDTEIPSDFAGVVYTPFDAAGHWRLEMVKELQAAGFDVDANRLIAAAV